MGRETPTPSHPAAIHGPPSFFPPTDIFDLYSFLFFAVWLYSFHPSSFISFCTFPSDSFSVCVPSTAPLPLPSHSRHGEFTKFSERSKSLTKAAEPEGPWTPQPGKNAVREGERQSLVLQTGLHCLPPYVRFQT
mgnify:CR=1 FL=1